jgi:hypothetical protein
MQGQALEVVFGLRDTLPTVGRRIAVWLATPLGARRRRDLERWLRGREQVSKLRRADAVVVSYGKAGRTWLRVLLSGGACRSTSSGCTGCALGRSGSTSTRSTART